MEIPELFILGMKHRLPRLEDPMPGKPVLNLGAGLSPMEGAHNLDLPDWDGDQDKLPYQDGEVGGIYAFHFLEHLWEPRNVLRECERVLCAGGPLTIVVPHAWGTMADHDLDHKKRFVIDTWTNLMNSTWQTGERQWSFLVGLNIAMGTTERNLALLTQLVKY